MEIKKTSRFELESRIKEIKSRIPPEILTILELLHERGIYVGVHGGGITHNLGKESDVDLVVIPPEFNPDFYTHLVKEIYTSGQQPPISLEDLIRLVGVYSQEVDYISLKIPTGKNPLSLHLEHPQFRTDYGNYRVARELRVPPKNSGISQYLDIAIGDPFHLIPIMVTVVQRQIKDLPEAVINFTHTSSLYPVECREYESLSPIISIPWASGSLSKLGHLFVFGLEANKVASEVNLFNIDLPPIEFLNPLITTLDQLAHLTETSFKESLRIYGEAYSRLLYERKDQVILPQQLIQTLPVLQAVSEYGEFL